MAVIALLLSGLSLTIAGRALALVEIVESEQRSAVKVEAMRQERDEAQDRRNEAQSKLNKKILELIQELMK